MDKMPFLEMMKLPMNIGNAVIEGGQVGLKGGDPLKATAMKIESALRQPFAMLPAMGQGGQPPALPMMGQLQALPSQLMALPQQLAPPMAIGSEYVGQKSQISGDNSVLTTIY